MRNEDSPVILTEGKTSDEEQALHGRTDHLALGLQATVDTVGPDIDPVVLIQ